MRGMVRPRSRRGPRGSFAERLRAARAARELTQDEAALSIGVHRVTLSKWETGEHVPKGIVLRVVEAWIVGGDKGGSHA